MKRHSPFLSSRAEESWACGRPKVMKSTSVRHPLSVEPVPLPCHPDRSEAERRDLRFRGPFVEMFFDRSVAQRRDLRFLFVLAHSLGPHLCVCPATTIAL